MAQKKRATPQVAQPKIDLFKLALSIFLCFSAAFIGSAFTDPEITSWYASLDKPWFSPPNWIFGPVWTVLYVLMGISFYLVWMKGAKDIRVLQALGMFGIQLCLNAVWSILFFGLHNPLLAFIEIIFLWIAIAATISLSLKVSRIGGLLLVPYLCWVSFASLLNFTIWELNP